MNKLAIKEEVLVRLENIEDEHILQSILNFIELEQHESKIQFTDKQLKEIGVAQKSVREKSISNKSVFSKTKEWLGK